MDALKLITEAQFQKSVTLVAEEAGWFVYHDYDSRRSSPGFPDLTMVSEDGRIIFAELKSQKGRVKKEQQAWLDRLGENPGVEVYLWRPSDLDFINKTLMGQQII